MEKTARVVYDDASTKIYTVCGCGGVFFDEGVGATDRYEEWKKTHKCSVRPPQGPQGA